jgi:hypothetical protein
MKKSFLLLIFASFSSVATSPPVDCEKAGSVEIDTELSETDVEEILELSVETGEEISSNDCILICETIYYDDGVGDSIYEIESCETVWYDLDSEGGEETSLGIICTVSEAICN